MAQPEQLARENTGALLIAAGWHVRDVDKTNLHAARGVAISEFPLKSGHGFADYAVRIMARETCKKCGEQLDDFSYTPQPARPRVDPDIPIFANSQVVVGDPFDRECW